MMRAPWVVLSGLLAIAQLPFGSTTPNCPVMGAEFPTPQRLAEHPTWKRALDNLTAVFDYLDGGNISQVRGASYAVQIFSTNPKEPLLWERYRTMTEMPTNTSGVKRVDGDTVFRLGSVSKVYTVLAFLAEAGDVYWNQPITKYIPELAKHVGRTNEDTFDGVRETAWDDITIGSLASQVSGLGRDYGVLGELTQTEDAPKGWDVGLPPLSNASIPSCGAWPLCSREDFFRGLTIMYPSYPAWQTASYSNVAYQLLAYALEKISGKPFKQVLEDRILKPLSLQRTYYDTAPPSVGVIPGTLKDMYWDVSLGDASPGGNMYSSASDLSKLGRAILTSAIIKPAMTRRWLNPVTFSSDFYASIGAPWGVRRIQLDKDKQPHRTLSVFTKAGTFRKYTSFITLLKDYNIGFTIMMAGIPSLSNFRIADLIGESVIPAYDAIARDEADKLFSGTYVSLERRGRRNALVGRSFMTIDTDPAKPGLGVHQWVSNGTDMVEMAVKLQSGSDYKPKSAETRLYFTQLESKVKGGGKRQSWKAVFEDTGGIDIGPQFWHTNCGSWVSLTGVTYASMPLDEFIFNFDSSGKVVSVENLALRSKLYKVDS